MWNKTISLVVILLMYFVMSGCRSVIETGETTDHETGKKISNSALQQLEPGKTTKEWTMSVFGPPTSHNKLQDGTEILKYDYSKKVSKKTNVWKVLDAGDEKVIKQSVFLEFKNNILTKYWKEEN